MGYREQPKTVPAIAAELGVRYILEGSVRRFDNTVKVTAQLIDSRDDTHVWAEVYERPRTDLFAIQADVARRIADALNARISPREAELLDTRPTRDTDAHDLYLQGLEATRRYHSAAELHRAVDLFREATARDPAFAEALAGEAHAHLWLWRFYYDHTPAREAAARTAAEAALRVRPVPRAHYVLAQLHLESGRIDPALAEVRRLEEILPNSADVADVRASIHDRRGRWAEVEENRLLAIARDPRNPGSRLALGAFLMDRGRLAEARAAFEEALVLDPANVTATFLAAAMRMQLEGDGGPVRAALERTDDPFGLSLIYAWFVEQMDERFDEAARVAAAAPTDRIDWETFVFAPLAAAAESRMAAGDTAGARADYTALRGKLDGWLRDTPDDSRLHSLLAVTLSHLGERAGALAAVERALELATAAENADLRNEHLMTESIVYANAGDYDNAFAALERFLDANGGWGQAWSGSWLQGAPELQRTSQGTTILRRYPPEALPAPVVRY
jgi:tetratricopeptide (TPR) repeat protein